LNQQQYKQAREELIKAFTNLLDEAEQKAFCSAQLEFKVKDGKFIHYEIQLKESHKI
jgi:hypothetical protein